MRISVCSGRGVALPVPATLFRQLVGDQWLLDKSQLQGMGLQALACCSAGLSVLESHQI